MRNGTFALVALSLLGWLIIIWSVANMSSPFVALMMPIDAGWQFDEIIAVWLMWAVMMGAMMLPSAIPMLVIYRRVSSKKDPECPMAHQWFLAAYLVSWASFSAAAAGVQWGFQRADVLTQMLKIDGSLVGGTLLVAAGIFQLSPLKSACLHKCRTAIGFLLTNWQTGRAGAFRMGLKHGQHCIGCCWALMIVLFVAGVMNLAAIAVVSGIVAIEKLAPRDKLIAKIGGILMIFWGLWLMSMPW